MQILNTSLGSGGDPAAATGGGPLQQDQAADIQNAINFVIDEQLQKKTGNGQEEDREGIGRQRLDLVEQAKRFGHKLDAEPTQQADVSRTRNPPLTTEDKTKSRDAAHFGADLQHLADRVDHQV